MKRLYPILPLLPMLMARFAASAQQSTLQEQVASDFFFNNPCGCKILLQNLHEGPRFLDNKFFWGALVKPCILACVASKTQDGSETQLCA